MDVRPDTPEARFGAELRRLRLSADLTLRKLGERLHRSHTAISGYETGRTFPSAEVVEQYQTYFGVLDGSLLERHERTRLERLASPSDGVLDPGLRARGHAVCPYKGLHAFESHDRCLFFGRRELVDDVLARLANARFVAVVGASGSGKSSFVRAGLLPGIQMPAPAGAELRVALLTPGEHPLESLAGTVSAALGGSVRLRSDDLRSDPDALGRATREPGGGPLAIVVDQFEELFTICRDEAERRDFVDSLIGAWRGPASRVTLIVGLRADFYGRVTRYPRLQEAVVAHQTLIGPMCSADLRRAIELPAAACGLLLQPGLAETVLQDLSGEPGALPLLSHALLETWKRRRGSMLTLSGYREAGGMHGALAQTAERTLLDLPPADQPVARSIFLSLAEVGEGVEPTRRRVQRAELSMHAPSAEGLDRVLGVLADARLISVDASTVVVAHEALIRHWPRLRGWIDADLEGLLLHRRVADAAREWDRLGREDGALYRGSQLAAAGQWADDHPDLLSRLERGFLAAGQALADGALRAERERARLALATAARRARRRLVVAIATAIATVLVAGLAIVAVTQRRTAERQATEATSLALASSASALLASRPDVSLLLALAAERTRPSVQARSSALAALTTARQPPVVAILRGHTDFVRSVAFSPDRRILASAGSDMTIRLWDVSAHAEVGAPMIGHTGAVEAVAFSPDGRELASGSQDRTIRLWDVRGHRQLGRPLSGHTNAVNAVAFSPDGRAVASASTDGTVRLWDVQTHRPLGQPMTAYAGEVDAVAFSPDGTLLASGGWDHTIRLWDVRTHKQLGAALRSKDIVTSVAFSPDGRTLASAGWDHRIRVWDLRTRTQLGPALSGHEDAVSSVAFSPDGRELASGSVDDTVRVWDARTHEPIGPPLIGHTDTVSSVAFSRDGRTLASGSADETVRLWDVGGVREPRAAMPGDTGTVAAVAFSPDGRTLASGSWDDTVRLWDVRSRAQLGAPLRADGAPVYSVAFSPDGDTLASASADKTIRLWEVRTRRQLGRPLTGNRAAVDGVAFSPDGRTLASAGWDHTVRLWDAATHRQIGRPLVGHDDIVESVAFSPDGRTLASASVDDTIRLWDVPTHRPLGGPLRGHTDAVTSVAFSPDGRLLASGSWDYTVRLWDVRSHKQVGSALTGHSGSENAVAFSPDGATLASASDDNTILLWDVRTHMALGIPLAGHGDSVESVAFSPDGRSLASASYDRTVRLWPRVLWRGDAELRAQACELVSSGLSRSEWSRYAPGLPYRPTCPT